MALKGSLTSVKRSSETATASRTVKPENRRESWKERPEPEPGAGRGRAVRDVDAGQLDPPRVGMEEPGDDVEQRRLAGAVGSDDPHDLAVVGVQGHVVQGVVAAEAEREPAHLDLGPAAPPFGAARPGAGDPSPSEAFWR